MPPRVEEQDSQIVAPDYDHGPFNYSDPMGIDDNTTQPNANASNDHSNGNALHQRFNASHESFRSVVEETQFMDLEIDTQAGTTQDTQMFRDSPTLQRILQSNDAGSHVALPTGSSEVPSSFLAMRPVDVQNHDIAGEFKFGTASKPKAGAYNRQTPRISSDNPAVLALPEKAPDEELRPVKREHMPFPMGKTSNEPHSYLQLSSKYCVS